VRKSHSEAKDEALAEIDLALTDHENILRVEWHSKRNLGSLLNGRKCDRLSAPDQHAELNGSADSLHGD
jgi:hypothetical protein